VRLTRPLFSVAGQEISGRDLVLIMGGLFLLAKSTHEIHGVMLVVEGFDQHIPKGYVYFAMAFSVLVEALNMRVRRKAEPVHLHEPYVPAGP
jgi:predicted tellurium resistance membrane protein TerC